LKLEIGGQVLEKEGNTIKKFRLDELSLIGVQKNLCLNCGKKMKNVKDKKTGKINKHLWKCGCRNLIISKG
jgi:hypothetical protein